MSGGELLHELQARGIAVTYDAGRMRCTAPPGVLDEATRVLLREHKELLLVALAEREAERQDPEIPQHSAGDQEKENAPLPPKSVETWKGGAPQGSFYARGAAEELFPPLFPAPLQAQQDGNDADRRDPATLPPTHEAGDPHTAPSALCADCGTVAWRAESRDWQWVWVCGRCRPEGRSEETASLPPVHDADDSLAKPSVPCAACGAVWWRVWCHDERNVWQWICNRCRPLVVHNPDGTLWRSDAPVSAPPVSQSTPEQGLDGPIGPIGPIIRTYKAPSREEQSRVMGYVRNVSQDPRAPRHPTEPCEKGHHEWEFARSGSFGGDGLSDVPWYGYVCRECWPADQYGCCLPREAYRELQDDHSTAPTGDQDGKDGDHG